MKTKQVKNLVHLVAVVSIALVLVATTAGGSVSAMQPMLNAADVGYVDFSYGVDVQGEPTADNPESKLWYNDGLWWSVMFDDATNQYAIYKLNWATQTWTKTATTGEIDSRDDTADMDPNVDVRFDALWDGTKLYLASHIQKENPSNVNTSGSVNWGRVYRYSYNTGTDTYSLDAGFPATNVSRAKTGSLVLDKDSVSRLWVTYVSRQPTSDPADVEPYHVYVNYTSTPGTDTGWAGTFNLSTVDATAATVTQDDVSSVVTYGTKIGFMWSNQLTGNFYYAEIDAGDNPATASNWTIVPVLAGTFVADDHIKLLANDGGEVFAAVKTSNGIGVIARETNGTFSYHVFTNGDGNNDTHPTLALNETTNTLYVFAVSSEAGGLICVNSTTVPTNLADMDFVEKSCGTGAGAADSFIENALYPNISNPTTTKHPFTTASGLVVLAADDDNGKRYLHNVIGGGVIDPPPPPDEIENPVYVPMIRR